MLSSVGLLSPANRGSLTTCALYVYVCLGSPAGYASARIYKSQWDQWLLKGWKLVVGGGRTVDTGSGPCVWLWPCCCCVMSPWPIVFVVAWLHSTLVSIWLYHSEWRLKCQKNVLTVYTVSAVSVSMAFPLPFFWIVGRNFEFGGCLEPISVEAGTTSYCTSTTEWDHRL